MIRTSKHSLKFSNRDKYSLLEKTLIDCKNQTKIYIEQIIAGVLPLKTHLSTALLSGEIIKHSHWKSFCYDKASEIVKSQIKKSISRRYKTYKKIYSRCLRENRFKSFTDKTFKELNLKPILQSKYFKKPELKNFNITISCNDFDFQNIESKEFDGFVRIKTPYFHEGKKRSITINLPFKHHRHSNDLKEKGFKLNNSIMLSSINNKLYINLFWEKEIEEKKTIGKSIGLDCGYKKLLISSENKTFDVGLESVYNKISRRKQGSKRFQRALTERDNKINQSINQIKFDEIKTIVVEDLKDVKRNSKGKINKKFNNKLQRWSYTKVLDRLSLICDERGIDLIKINPAYTSQKCSKCGFIHKDNRKKEKFLCMECRTELDVDYNASINILHSGIYSSSDTKSSYYGDLL